MVVEEEKPRSSRMSRRPQRENNNSSAVLLEESRLHGDYKQDSLDQYPTLEPLPRQESNTLPKQTSEVSDFEPKFPLPPSAFMKVAPEGVVVSREQPKKKRLKRRKSKMITSLKESMSSYANPITNNLARFKNAILNR
mmetsp:Transcript_5879/g.9513  ORF Transcript_5879/g.9513 Transcript_5879/m.9513 type:complete len:138 (-) Transcript_5879:760-1173(-)